ncbi:MAG: Uma2 family endonuclease, partial [Myxococcales bacterium]|nr:Uma2 family endonuclease [Myxococcales bacterium]
MARAQARLGGMDGRHATYDDVLAAPEGAVAELVQGELWLSARPALAHLRAQQGLAHALTRRLDHRLRDDGPDVPGGWVVLQEPELWLGGPVGRDPVLVPDVAAWRVERFPHDAREHGLAVPPDWVCEVRSPHDG